MNRLRPEADRSSGPSESSRPELASLLHGLFSAPPGSPDAKASLQRVAEELQGNRAELEMQNSMLREIQSELEHALHRYTDLYDSLPIGYVTLTADGCIVECNLTAADMVRCERTQLPGLFLRQFLAGKNTLALSAHLAACAENDQRQILEVTIEPLGGVSFFAQLSSRRATRAEGDVIIRTALTDISELKTTQHMLEETVAEQESFAYSISHDLRSPLLTISNFSALLLDDTAAFAPTESREILGRIHRAATRMDRLLLNLLDYTRVSRNPVPLEPVSLEEIVNDVLLEHQGAIRERHAVLEVQSALPRAIGSRALLNQALSNLLSNALKYTPSERAPVIRISARETERTIVLTVADEGIGIPLQHQERIFRIFERLHSQAAYPGTGIGLALVRRAAERMRGRVWVESEEGRGSRFHLALPRAEMT